MFFIKGMTTLVLSKVGTVNIFKPNFVIHGNSKMELNNLNLIFEIAIYMTEMNAK